MNLFASLRAVLSLSLSLWNRSPYSHRPSRQPVQTQPYVKHTFRREIQYEATIFYGKQRLDLLEKDNSLKEGGL
jgi:hypothetical protein